MINNIFIKYNLKKFFLKESERKKKKNEIQDRKTTEYIIYI